MAWAVSVMQPITGAAIDPQTAREAVTPKMDRMPWEEGIDPRPSSSAARSASLRGKKPPK